MRIQKGEKAMKQKRFLAFVLGLAIVALALPWGTRAESFDPAADLKYDIEILGLMTGEDFSAYPLPTVKIVPEAEYDHKVKRLAENGVIPLDTIGFFDCETDPNLIEISSAYSTEYVKFKKADLLPESLTSQKYFRLKRFHELYHWEGCKLSGVDRFWGSESSVMHEENYANLLEMNFLREQLGVASALPADYHFPVLPRNMPEGTLPDDGIKTEYRGLRSQMWKLVESGKGLVPWRTVSGSALFVGIGQATALVKKENYYPNYDVPGQHIPRVQDPSVMYYFNAVMHRGNFVAFEVFEVGGDNAAFGVKHGLWTKKYSWWDAGYVPVMKDGKTFAPDNPVYTGKWVQTLKSEDTK